MVHWDNLGDVEPSMDMEISAGKRRRTRNQVKAIAMRR